MRPAAIEAEVQARQDELKQNMQNWLHHGHCKRRPDLNFTPEWSEDVETVEAALKAVCNTCPVQLLCLDHALRFPECAGVWGGKTEKERKALRHGEVVK